VLHINLQYENREKCKRGFDPVVRNVHLKNVTCEKSQFGVMVIGLDDDKHVYNISVEDSHFNNVSKDRNDIKGAKDVTFKNLYINGKLVE
ncbi:MAG: glycoside hydrolase family 28 protein, partial [Bacteroides reticulotermitis]